MYLAVLIVFLVEFSLAAPVPENATDYFNLVPKNETYDVNPSSKNETDAFKKSIKHVSLFS